MKTVNKVVAIAFVFALLLIPAAAIVCSEESNAAAPTIIINDTPQVTSSFSDKDAGTIKVVVKNTAIIEQVVTIKILYYSDYIEKVGGPITDKTVTVPATESLDVYLTFSFSSRGEKDLVAVAYDQEGTELSHNFFSLDVSHSIWKDPITYVVIVLVALLIIVIIAIKIRSSGVGKKGSKKVVDPNQPTFTQMEEERQAKKVERKSKKR